MLKYTQGHVIPWWDNSFKKLNRNDINNEIVFIGRKCTNVKDKSDKIVVTFNF